MSGLINNAEQINTGLQDTYYWRVTTNSIRLYFQKSIRIFQSLSMFSHAIQLPLILTFTFHLKTHLISMCEQPDEVLDGNKVKIFERKKIHSDLEESL